MSRRLALAAVLGVIVPSLRAQSPDPAAGTVTLRLRNAPLVEVVHALHTLTGQGFVVDSDVLGNVDVELVDVSPMAIEQALGQIGLSISDCGLLRRVTAGSEIPSLRLSGAGDPVSLEFRRGDVRDILRLMMDIMGAEFVVPRGPLGHISLFGEELPSEDMLRAILASARLEFRREEGRIVVWRRSEPDAPLLPVGVSERHYGHVPYRAEGVGARPAGLQGVLAEELRLTGTIRRGSRWTAMVIGQDRPYEVGDGYRLFDATVESVSAGTVLILREDGKRIELKLGQASPGVSMMPEDLGLALERASVRRDAGDFDTAEGLLRAALQTSEGHDRQRVSAELADLHYAWGQSLLSRHAASAAIRQFETAHEIDDQARPWQDGEDLNEIGFAWAELGEPERAVGPHRRALEIARTIDLSKEPRPFSCVRTHPRSAWIEPSALNGLGNAERVRGRLAASRALYEQAIPLWRKVEDPFGESAALTGLGLVQQGLGHVQRAIELHRQALSKPLDRHPWARAVVLNNLGSAQLAAGRVDEARASLTSALETYRMLRDRGGEGAVLNNLGVLAESRSRPGEACALYEEALEASRDADDRPGEVTTREHLQQLVARSAPDDPSLSRCRPVVAAEP